MSRTCGRADPSGVSFRSISGITSHADTATDDPGPNLPSLFGEHVRSTSLPSRANRPEPRNKPAHGQDGRQDVSTRCTGSSSWTGPPRAGLASRCLPPAIRRTVLGRLLPWVKPALPSRDGRTNDGKRSPRAEAQAVPHQRSGGSIHRDCRCRARHRCLHVEAEARQLANRIVRCTSFSATKSGGRGTPRAGVWTSWWAQRSGGRRGTRTPDIFLVREAL